MRRLFLPTFIINILFIFSIVLPKVAFAGILEGEGMMKPIIDGYQATGDLECPEANPALGISYFCGYVKTGTVDTVSTDFGGLTQVSNQPIKGAVVAVYQAIPTPVGKSVSDANPGSLGSKVNEASTDARGHFVIPVPMLGAAANRIYPLVFCHGQRMDGVMTTSIYSNFTVFKVSCPTNLSPVPAPEELSLVTDRSSFLTCDTPELDTESSTAAKTVGFGNLAVKNEIDNVLFEVEFDTRFKKTNGSLLLRPHDGAWWSYDCVYRRDYAGEINSARNAPLKCYTTSSAPLGPTPGAQIIDLDNLDEVEDRDYIIANTLDTLPLLEEMELYRRYEHRYALTGQYQFAAAPASFLQNMFGNPTGSIEFLKHGQEQDDVLPVSCENFRKANITVADSPEENSGTFNAYIAGGPAVGLAGPTTWETIYVKLLNSNDPLLDEPVCIREGDPNKVPVTLRQIEPPKTWLSFDRPGSDAYLLGEEYFHPFMLLKKGDGSLEVNSDSRHDSAEGSTPRINNFSIKEQREGYNQQAHGSKIVLPEASSGASSPVAASSITGESVYTEGGALTDTMSDPFPVEQEIVSDGKKVYDIGPSLQALCSKASYSENTNVATDLINNLFNPDGAQKKDTTSSTQIYYTPIAKLRDKLLEESDEDKWDSFLSVFEADESKYSVDIWRQISEIINPSQWGIHGSGEYKTYFHRRAEGEFGDAKLVGITIRYPLNEENFGDFFKGGNLVANPSGSGGLGDYGEGYPWTPLNEGEMCEVWGNQYYPDVNACNSDDNCLRTCRLEGHSDSSCQRKSPVAYCIYTNGSCNCEIQTKEASCTPEEKFECVFRGLDTDGEEGLALPVYPSGNAACCGAGVCQEGDTRIWKSNESSLKCELEKAGPYNEAIDLEDRPGHYQSQGSVKNTAPKEDVSVITEVGNDWLSRLSSPSSALVNYGMYAASDYQTSKKSSVNMFGKDNTGVGSGTSAPFTSLVADPVFPPIEAYGPDASAIIPQDLAGLVTPAPKEVTAQDILDSINKDTSCKINACPQLNVLGKDYTALIDILNAAGADWSVPAEVLLAFMYAERTLENYDWNDANTYKWSLPLGGTVTQEGYMSECDDLTWSDIGVIPTFLRQWECPSTAEGAENAYCDTTSGFWQCVHDGGYGDPQKCGVEKIAPGRGTYARRCNVLDSAYGLAKAAASYFAYSKTSCTQWSDQDKRDVINMFGVADKKWGGGGDAGYMNLMYEILTQCN